MVMFAKAGRRTRESIRSPCGSGCISLLCMGMESISCLELVHRHRSSAVQLFSSILADQDHQELSRFDFEVVTHSCQLIFAEPGGVDLGARNGLVMTLRDDGNIQQIAALEFGLRGP